MLQKKYLFLFASALCTGLMLFSMLYRKTSKPRVTIITSLYNGDLFIEGFLHDIVQQTIFNQCELLIINANSPGNETPIIETYCKRYPNIRYIKLNHDPGLYGVWNLGIKMARADYVTNANVDDRLAYTCYEEHANCLDNHPEVNLVYSDHYASYVPNEDFYAARLHNNGVWYYREFSQQNNEAYCLGGNHPMWRLSMHDKAGLFNETFACAGDWEMWIRAGRSGSIFKKINKNLAVFFINRKGLSAQDRHKNEIARIEKMYEIQHQW